MIHSKSLCLAPFRSVYLNGGVARPCCWYNKSSLENKNTAIKDVAQVFESKDFSEIRKKMKEGKNVPGCERCIKHENIGGKSHRQYWNEREFSDLKLDDFTHEIKAMDIYMGNLCNLKCVTCNSTNSSPWIADEVQLQGKPFQDHIEKFNLDQIDEKAFESVEWLKLAGGETLLMPEHKQLLDFLVNKNFAKNISLVYVCNNTIHPKNFIKQWSHFKNIRIILSVDGVGAVNEYIRYPAVWSENVEIVKEYLSLGDHYDVEVNSVVSLLNIFHLKELSQWWRFVGKGRPIFYRLIDRPEHLRIQKLPLELRDKAMSEISEISDLDHIFKELRESPIEAGFDSSIDWLEKLDSLRKVSLQNINPMFFK